MITTEKIDEINQYDDAFETCAVQFKCGHVFTCKGISARQKARLEKFDCPGCMYVDYMPSIEALAAWRGTSVIDEWREWTPYYAICETKAR